jgi:hypothetical protein
MPGPESLTISSTCDFTRSSRTWARPPSGVNLIALDSAFSNLASREHPRPAVDRRQRGPQLVGNRHEEFILQTTRFLCLTPRFYFAIERLLQFDCTCLDARFEVLVGVPE